MKWIAFLLLTVCCSLQLSAQPRYNIVPEPTCWTTPGDRDSSITRIVLVSSPGGKQTIGYIDQYAAPVTVDSGSFQACFCEELPGWVYPPPGGLNMLFMSWPTINPFDPQCVFGISFDVEFEWEVGDVTATFDGQPVGLITKVGQTLVIDSADQLPLGNCDAADFPHTWIITVINSGGNATKTVSQPLTP